MDTDAVMRLLQDVAAEVIEPRFRSLRDAEVDEKGPGDLVTAADHEAEVLITAALTEAFPGAVVLGEEAHAADHGLLDRFLAADHSFTVDPVDGTNNFVRGSADHAVMVAEVRDGEAVRGWLWQPQHRTAYVAERGLGARRDDTVLTRSPAGPAPHGATSRRRWRTHGIGDLAPLRHTWFCCGVDYPHLVEGDVDFLLYAHPKPWDHAPTSLLVTEAGGYVGTIEGTAYTPVTRTEMLIAAADRATYDRVRQALEDDARVP